VVARSLSVRTSGGLTAPVRRPVRPLPSWPVALNLVGYQAGWLATLYGATHDLPSLGPVSVTVLVALHLYLSARPARSAGVIAITLLFGALQETAMFKLGLLTYPTSPGGVPVWMLALWPLFATTLSVSLRWFQTRLAIAALAGAVLGPLAYWAGAAAGAIVLPDLQTSLGGLAIAWMAGFPALLALAHWLDRPLAAEQ
jgi:hypothetical protein